MSQAIIEAIRSRFDALVKVPTSLRVVYDNGPEPAGMVGTWAQFFVSIDDTRQVSVGLVRYRSTGSATVNLYVPAASGDKAANELADAVVAAFRGVALSTPQIVFSPTPAIVGGVRRDEAWSIRTVRIPFRADTFAE
jgi:hypothetical protein